MSHGSKKGQPAFGFWSRWILSPSATQVSGAVGGAGTVTAAREKSGDARTSTPSKPIPCFPGYIFSFLSSPAVRNVLQSGQPTNQSLVA